MIHFNQTLIGFPISPMPELHTPQAPTVISTLDLPIESSQALTPSVSYEISSFRAFSWCAVSLFLLSNSLSQRYTTTKIVNFSIKAFHAIGLLGLTSLMFYPPSRNYIVLVSSILSLIQAFNLYSIFTEEARAEEFFQYPVKNQDYITTYNPLDLVTFKKIKTLAAKESNIENLVLPFEICIKKGKLDLADVILLNILNKYPQSLINSNPQSLINSNFQDNLEKILVLFIKQNRAQSIQTLVKYYLFSSEKIETCLMIAAYYRKLEIMWFFLNHMNIKASCIQSSKRVFMNPGPEQIAASNQSLCDAVFASNSYRSLIAKNRTYLRLIPLDKQNEIKGLMQSDKALKILLSKPALLQKDRVYYTNLLAVLSIFKQSRFV
jgi:hypothetical protein